MDTPETHISCDTYLSTDSSSPWSRRLLDTALSRMLELAIILTWHGVWSLMDLGLEQFLGMTRMESAWTTWYIGIIGASIMFFYQFILLCLFKAGGECFVVKSLFYILYYVFLLIGEYFYTIQVSILNYILGLVTTISLFRAYWYLLDVYYLPESMVTSWSTSMVMGLSILSALRAVSCLHAGIVTDNPR